MRELPFIANRSPNVRCIRRSAGFGEREARAATSLDLGHGDGRGRYIASLYARRVLSE